MTTAVQVQYRRGSSTQVLSFTGAAGEMVVDTTNNRVVIQDGSTTGGWPAAKLSEVQTNNRTQVSDGGYTALTTDRTIAYITLTAARAVALPAASTYPTGTRLLVVDETGNCSATKTITLNRNGSDLIDGAASAVINSAYGYLAIESNGANSWTIIDQVATAPVPSVNGLTGGLSIVSSGGFTVTASGTTITIGGAGGMINKFRNGTMDVWQRGTGSITVTTSGGYTADGWIVLPTGASVTAAQASGRLTTKNSLQVTGATSVTDLIIKQRIESLIAAAFCSQTVTVQAEIYNGTGGSITPKLTVNHPSTQDPSTALSSSYANTDVNAVSLQACPASAWTLVSYTFAANAACYNGLEIVFDFGNNFGANTKTVQVTELDIRVAPGVSTGLNSNPPPPELRPVTVELMACQRYYWQLTPSASGAYLGIAQADSTTNAFGLFFALPVQMRATPTPSFSAASDFSLFTASGSGPNAASAMTLSARAPGQFVATSITTTGLVAGNAAAVQINDTTGWVSASAEL